MRPFASLPSSPPGMLMLMVYAWLGASIVCFQVAAALSSQSRASHLKVVEDALELDLKEDLPEITFLGSKNVEDPLEQEVEEDLPEISFLDSADIEDDENEEVEYEEEMWEDDFEDYPESGVDRSGDESDDELTEEDIRDLREAKEAMDALKVEIDSRAVIDVPPATKTYINPNNQYSIKSHNTFGIDRYPNGYKRIWYFCKTPRVIYTVVNCPFFRIEWSHRCKNDQFAIFKSPFYTRGIRRCGQIHGFYKKYTDDCIKIIFKSNYINRRAGFVCKVKSIARPPTTTTTSSSTSTSTSTSTTSSTSTSTSTSTSSTSSTSTTSTTSTTTTTFMDGCPVPPQIPSNRTVVRQCSNIRPGYNPPCNCSAVLTGICLVCQICTACDLEFFAVHDFSQVKLYIHFNYVCTNHIDMTKSPLPYGFPPSVYGLVMCFPPPLYIIQPTFPAFTSIFFLPCPLTTAPCRLFRTYLGRRRELWHEFQDNLLEIEGPSKHLQIGGDYIRTLESLEGFGCDSKEFHLLGIEGDISTVCHPEVKEILEIVVTTSEMFPMNLCLFTSLKTLRIQYVNGTVPNGSVMVCSADILDIEISPWNPSAVVCCPKCPYCDKVETALG